MKNLNWAVLFSLLLASASWGQTILSFAEMENDVANFALKNQQRRGAFVFLPLPPPKAKGIRSMSDGVMWSGVAEAMDGDRKGERYEAVFMEIVLHTMSEYERRCGAISYFQVIRDPRVYGSDEHWRSRIYGILIKSAAKTCRAAEKE